MTDTKGRQPVRFEAQIDSVPSICLLTCGNGEASGKDRLDRGATDRAAAALAASARVGIAARHMGRDCAEFDSFVGIYGFGWSAALAVFNY